MFRLDIKKNQKIKQMLPLNVIKEHTLKHKITKLEREDQATNLISKKVETYMKDQTINKVPNQVQNTLNDNHIVNIKVHQKKEKKKRKRKMKQLLRRCRWKLRSRKLKHGSLLSLKGVKTTSVILREGSHVKTKAINPLR